MNTDGPLILTPVAARRRGRLAVAVWLAALVAVVTWVLAAGIGSAPRDGRSAAPPGGSASPPLSRSPRSTDLLVGPRPTGTVWLGSGNGVRSFDLLTGKAGPAMHTGDWRDRVLYLPDGRFLCVCLEVTSSDESERAVVRLANIVDGKPTNPIELVTIVDGKTRTSTELVTLDGARDQGAPVEERAEAVATSASLSSDGSLIAIGVAVRHPPKWERSLLVVHVPSREVQTIELASVPADPRVVAVAPSVQFSDGVERVLVGLTVLEANVVTDERYFVSWIHGNLLGLEPAAGFGTKGEHADGRCSSTTPRLVGYETLFAICHDGNWTPSFLRSVEIKTGRIRELDLGPVLNGFWPMTLVDGSAAFLWDPFSHRVARVHLPSANVEASAVIDTPTAGLQPLDRLARSFSAWIAPAALAKILLEPGLALSPDGGTLYVVAMSGEGIVEPGRASTILALDAGTLAVRATWTVEPDVVSIDVTADGDVLVGTLPIAPEGIAPEATLTLLDADTGRPRVRYEGLGTEWPRLVEPSAINR